MKKNSTIYTIVAVAAALVVVGCSSIVEQPGMNPDVGIATLINSNPLTKSESIALVVQQKGTYKISTSEALEKLDRFAYSASENKDATIQVQNTTLKQSQTTGKDMYYIVTFESEKGSGFSMLSADERAGGVLCYSEVGSIADTSFNKSLKFCLELVDVYVEEQTKEELDIDALVMSAKEKLALKKLELLSKGLDPPPFDPNTWTYEGIFWEDVEDVRLKPVPSLSHGATPVGWHQSPPLNDSLPIVPGIGTSNGKAYVGCLPVAVAQIMAYWKKPFETYLTTSSSWNTMLSNANTSVELRKFIKEIFDRIIIDHMPNYAVYNTTGSGVDADSTVAFIRSFLSNHDFFVGPAYLYNSPYNLPGFEYTWNAMMYGPTYMEGGTHTWVAEGAKIVTQKWFELWSYKQFFYKVYTPIFDTSQKYVKCRWGWDNLSTTINTWFVDNVFSVTVLGTLHNYNSNVYVVQAIY